MPVKLNNLAVNPGQSEPTIMIDGDLRCVLTGRRLRPDEVYWAHPLITVGELMQTIWQTLRTAPGNLGHVLLDEPSKVPYAPEARELLARRRSTEQLKLIGLLLLIAAAFIIPIILLVS